MSEAGAVERPLLVLDPAPGSGMVRGVRLRGVDPATLRPSNDGSHHIPGRTIRVTVTGADDTLPDVVGSCLLDGSDVLFVPHLPFELGVTYRARFGPRALGAIDGAEASELVFSMPRQAGAPPAVTAIYPSADVLPENLLRFTVCFSAPMRRGSARSAIALVGPEGETVEDALYRAPVELWDRQMRRLTVLLDPGRLKRGVGPNRDLGPPLTPGATYALVVGREMTAGCGQTLPASVRKSFRVAGAVREPVDVSRWRLDAPAGGTLEPLNLTFPQPLDWALLTDSLVVTSEAGQPVAGHVAVAVRETQWRFTPAAPWRAGPYLLHIAGMLEDVCGNDLAGPFERPLRREGDTPVTAAVRTLAFDIR